MLKGTRSLKSVQTQTRMASLQFGKPLLIFFFAFLFYSASFTWLQIELQQRHLAYCGSSSVSSARSPVFILITRYQRAQIHWDVPDRDLNFQRIVELNLWPFWVRAIVTCGMQSFWSHKRKHVPCRKQVGVIPFVHSCPVLKSNS